MADVKKQSNKLSEDAVKPQASPDVIAIELRRAREAKGLSHSDLHRLTGISRSVLFGYEVGRTKPGAKELKLLSEALMVNPNRLLFGTDEPFKPRTGLRALAKVGNSPAGIAVAMMIIPIIFASLDEDQLESVLTILASLVEARDKDAAKKIAAFSEVMGELIGNGTPEEMSAIASKRSDPAFMEMIEQMMEKKLQD